MFFCWSSWNLFMELMNSLQLIDRILFRVLWRKHFLLRIRSLAFDSLTLTYVFYILKHTLFLFWLCRFYNQRTFHILFQRSFRVACAVKSLSTLCCRRASSRCRWSNCKNWFFVRILRRFDHALKYTKNDFFWTLFLFLKHRKAN